MRTGEVRAEREKEGRMCRRKMRQSETDIKEQKEMRQKDEGG